MYRFRKTLNVVVAGLLSYGLMAQPTLPPCAADQTLSDESLVFDLAGATAGFEAGDPDNSVITICNPNLANAEIDLISWDAIDIEPVGLSWCSEVTFEITDASGNVVGALAPAIAEGNVGPCMNGYTSGGDVSLSADLGAPPIILDAGGCLTIEVTDSFNDEAGVDANITSGNITVHQEVCLSPPPIPTMGEWGLICLTFLLMIFGIVSVKQRSTSLEGAL